MQVSVRSTIIHYQPGNNYNIFVFLIMFIHLLQLGL